MTFYAEDCQCQQRLSNTVTLSEWHREAMYIVHTSERHPGTCDSEWGSMRYILMKWDHFQIIIAKEWELKKEKEIVMALQDGYI